MSIYIAGTGSYLPERILTNADLEKLVDTSDEWIRTRTGISERHIASKDQATSDLAREAALRIDWQCEVTTRFLDANLGCRKAVSSAIDWFFDEVEEGIILEDDCLP